jgi:hypothetical protein
MLAAAEPIDERDIGCAATFDDVDDDDDDVDDDDAEDDGPPPAALSH